MQQSSVGWVCVSARDTRPHLRRARKPALDSRRRGRTRYVAKSHPPPGCCCSRSVRSCAHSSSRASARARSEATAACVMRRAASSRCSGESSTRSVLPPPRCSSEVLRNCSSSDLKRSNTVDDVDDWRRKRAGGATPTRADCEENEPESEKLEVLSPSEPEAADFANVWDPASRSSQSSPRSVQEAAHALSAGLALPSLSGQRGNKRRSEASTRVIASGVRASVQSARDVGRGAPGALAQSGCGRPCSRCIEHTCDTDAEARDVFRRRRWALVVHLREAFAYDEVNVESLTAPTAATFIS